MITAALVSKRSLLRADGRHVFNPSTLPLVHIIGNGDVSREIGLPPNMLEVMVLLALIVQLRVPIVLISLSALAALRAYQLTTGFTYFYPYWAPMLLVLMLVVTDPATTPRTAPGHVLYGAVRVHFGVVRLTWILFAHTRNASGRRLVARQRLLRLHRDERDDRSDLAKSTRARHRHRGSRRKPAPPAHAPPARESGRARE